jgi:hypothetical protein
LPRRGPKVQGKASLISVEHEVVVAFSWGKARPEQSRVIATTGPFDVNNIRTQIAQDHPTERPRDEAPKVEHAQTAKCTFVKWVFRFVMI